MRNALVEHRHGYVALLAGKLSLGHGDAHRVLACAEGSERDDAVVYHVAGAPVAEALPHCVGPGHIAIDAVELRVIFAEGLARGAAGPVDKHERVVYVDVMPSAVILLASAVGSVIGCDEHQLRVASVVLHREVPCFHCFADGVGACGVIVVEVPACIFGPLHVYGHQLVVVGIVVVAGPGNEFECSFKHVAASGAACYLLVGGIRHAEKLKLYPYIMVGQNLLVTQNIGHIVYVIAVGHHIGLLVLVHERCDEASYLNALHRVGYVSGVALGHKSQVDVANAVVVVAAGLHKDVHAQRVAYEGKLFGLELYGIERCAVTQYAVAHQAVGVLLKEVAVVEGGTVEERQRVGTLVGRGRCS